MKYNNVTFLIITIKKRLIYLNIYTNVYFINVFNYNNILYNKILDIKFLVSVPWLYYSSVNKKFNTHYHNNCVSIYTTLKILIYKKRILMP